MIKFYHWLCDCGKLLRYVIPRDKCENCGFVIPTLRPKPNVSMCDEKEQIKLNAEIDAEYEQWKLKYIEKYGVNTLNEELKRRKLFDEIEKKYHG